MKDATHTPAPAAKRTFDIDRLRLPALALLSFIYVFGSNWLFMCRYGVNDNSGVLEYAQLGLPSAAMGVPLVKLLHLGYTLLPALPWYGLCYYLFHVLSIFVWLWSFSRIFRPWWLSGIFSLAFLGYYLPFVLLLDYTDTAMMLCAASLSWLLLEAMEQRPGHMRFLAPGLMFALGALARPEVPLGSLAYAFPLAVLVLLARMRLQPFAKEIPRLALIGLIFFAPMAVNLAADAVYRQYIESPQQRQYDRYDAVREELEKHTTRARKQMIMRDTSLLSSIGWTRIDAVHIFNWNYLDERKDTIQALQTLLDKAPPRDISPGDFIQGVRAQFVIDPSPLLLLGAALISLLSLWRQRWLGVVSLAAPLYCIVFTTFMTQFFLYSDRTELPLVMGCGFMSLLVCYRVATPDRQEPDKPSIAVALLSALLVCSGAYSTLSAAAADRSHIVQGMGEAQQKLATLNGSYAGRVLLLQPGIGSRQITNSDPLETPTVRYQPIDLGWSTFSPLFYSQIGKLGIHHGYELVDALVDNPNAYLVGTAGWCYNLLDYVDAARRPRIQTVEILKFADGSSLYQLREEKK